MSFSTIKTSYIIISHFWPHPEEHKLLLAQCSGPLLAVLRRLQHAQDMHQLAELSLMPYLFVKYCELVVFCFKQNQFGAFAMYVKRSHILSIIAFVPAIKLFKQY